MQTQLCQSADGYMQTQMCNYSSLSMHKCKTQLDGQNCKMHTHTHTHARALIMFAGITLASSTIIAVTMKREINHRLPSTVQTVLTLLSHL